MIQTFSPFSLPPYAAKHEAHCLVGQEKELLDYEYIAPVTNEPPMTELLGILSLSAWLLVCCEHQFEWIKCSDRESTEKERGWIVWGPRHTKKFWRLCMVQGKMFNKIPYNHLGGVLRATKFGSKLGKMC